MTGQSRRTVGSHYETVAEQCLKKQGYKILERNFYCRQGEIDLIARDGEVLVFVEVKYRKSLNQGDPMEAVNDRKQRRIVNRSPSRGQ